MPWLASIPLLYSLDKERDSTFPWTALYCYSGHILQYLLLIMYKEIESILGHVINTNFLKLIASFWGVGKKVILPSEELVSRSQEIGIQDPWSQDIRMQETQSWLGLGDFLADSLILLTNPGKKMSLSHLSLVSLAINMYVQKYYLYFLSQFQTNNLTPWRVVF